MTVQLVKFNIDNYSNSLTENSIENNQPKIASVSHIVNRGNHIISADLRWSVANLSNKLYVGVLEDEGLVELQGYGVLRIPGIHID